MRIRKSRCIESDQTHCSTRKFNTAFSLCGVLEIALYFSEGFLEAAARRSAVAEASQPLGVTVVCFLGQKSNLQSPTPQQRHRLFLRCFLHSSLVNLPLLASLEERSICRVLGCFLGAGDRDDLQERFLADEIARDRFALFWEAMVGPEVEAFPCFQE